MSDLAAQLRLLRQQRDAAIDPALRAAFATAIAALERVLPPATGNSQSYGDGTSAGVIIGGSSSGTVLAPLFTSEANGAYVAEVINLYQQSPAAAKVAYGPALRRYLEHLYHRHATLDLRGINDRPMDMPLSELYVSLALHEPPPDEIRGPHGLRRFIERVRRWVTREQGDDDGIEQRYSGQPEPVDWSVALRHPRLAVIGGPGSGKTTLLQYTTVRLAEVLARDDDATLADLGLESTAPPIPLLLPLRALGEYIRESNRRERVDANPRLLLDCLGNYYQRFDLDLPEDFFSRLCDRGRALLLLDGLDEVAHSDDRVFVSGIVREFALRYPKCRYVLTARVAAYHGDTQIGAGFRICTVADLNEDLQQRFISNWSRSLHRLLYNLSGEALDRDASRFANNLWSALDANDRVRELATNPLLLTVVAVIFYNNYVLPEDRAALYEECVNVLLRGGLGKPYLEFNISFKPKRELLAAVAYAMHCRGEEGLFVSREELVVLVTESLRGRDQDADAVARAFVDELPVHIGLLDEREPDRFRFSHLQFQEFLAARHVAESDRWPELLDRHNETWWREVILLCAGYLSSERCWRFLAQLIERGSDPVERAGTLELATEALAELERFKGQGPISQQIAADALAIFNQPSERAPAAARISCSRVLAHLGDPRPHIVTLPPPMIAFTGGLVTIGPREDEQAIIAQVRNVPRSANWPSPIRSNQRRVQKNILRPVLPTEERTAAVASLNAKIEAALGTEKVTYRRRVDSRTYRSGLPILQRLRRLFNASQRQRIRGTTVDRQIALERLNEKMGVRDQPEVATCEVLIASFALARYPVTNAQYALFIADGGYNPEAAWWDGPGKAWLIKRGGLERQPRYWADSRFGAQWSNQPVVGVTWYEALSFCRWLSQHTVYNPQGYRYTLPSEVEWEYAARGSERRIFPWGDEHPDEERANYGRTYNGTTAVGCFPLGATPEGLHEMAGNVWEWTRSAYAPYPYDPADGREEEHEVENKHFTLRGGSWCARSADLRASYRSDAPPDYDSTSSVFGLPGTQKCKVFMQCSVSCSGVSTALSPPLPRIAREAGGCKGEVPLARAAGANRDFLQHWHENLQAALRADR